jgi:magnesium chelatase family protein
VTIAHRGVLFLDEFPEFSRHALEHLRQPIEDGYVSVARAGGTVSYPARFLLAASMNPCPCGFASDPREPCTCSPHALSAYRKRLSGPLMDRFDLVIEVPKVEGADLFSRAGAERSEAVRGRVQGARRLQRDRFAPLGFFTNAEIPAALLDRFAPLDDASESLLRQAVEKGMLSPRGVARVRKLSRTIADVSGERDILPSHVAEALQFRLRDAGSAKRHQA